MFYSKWRKALLKLMYTYSNRFSMNFSFNRDNNVQKKDIKSERILYFDNNFKQEVQPNYYNFFKMSDQAHEQLNEYEKFRLLKLGNRKDDDNCSAHFSNFSANISMLAKSEREININSFRSSHDNEEDFVYFKKQLSEKEKEVQVMNKKYAQLQNKHNELLRSYKVKCEESDKFKKLYEGELNRQKQTKVKLKNWVKEAKNNLNS